MELTTKESLENADFEVYANTPLLFSRIITAIENNETDIFKSLFFNSLYT